MDYELQLKIKNAPFLNIMREAGYDTAAKLSKACGINQVTIGRVLNLSITAYLPDGYTLSRPVKRLADFFNVHAEELFPEKHLRTKLQQNEFNVQVEAIQLAQLENSAAQDPCRLLEVMETEERDVYLDMLECSGLTSREKLVLDLRIRQSKTLPEIGVYLDVKSERVRQIEAKALRKMRHPRRATKIIEAAGIYSENIDAARDYSEKHANVLSEDYGNGLECSAAEGKPSAVGIPHQPQLRRSPRGN